MEEGRRGGDIKYGAEGERWVCLLYEIHQTAER